jgi:hypothetical protein
MLRSAFSAWAIARAHLWATVVLLALDYAQAVAATATLTYRGRVDFSTSVERHGPRKMVCVARS